MVSRRRRYYGLRVAFVALFVLFLISTWYQVLYLSTSVVDIVARMSQASKSITAFVIWFEFIACQLVAGVMLSTSISDEISSRTLGVLMTTPITSLQIVVGKLFSRLLQVCLLLAVTLPILAAIRVFGGIPWAYLLSSLTLILCRCLLVGSVSLVFSIYARRAYVAILATALTFVLLDGILPGVVAVQFHDEMPRWVSMIYLNCCNSFTLLGGITEAMFNSRRSLPGAWLHWVMHDLLLLTLSAFLIGWAALRVRCIGLQMVTGGLASRSRVSAQSGGRVRLRPVKGHPVFWKEMRQPLFGRHRRRSIVLLAFILITLALFYTGMIRNNDIRGGHVAIGLILMGAGFLYSTVIPATVISKEKETRTWPILLGTTLTSRQILIGKFWGSLRHSLPAWYLLIGHLVFFMWGRAVHPLSLFLLLLAISGPVVFLQGTGLFFSARFRRTTTAVVANLLLAAVVWVLLPILLGWLLSLLRLSGLRLFGGMFEWIINFNPLVQAVIILESTTEAWEPSRAIRWPTGRMNVDRTLAMLVFSSFLYSVAGGVFMVLGRRSLRSRIF